MTFDLFDSEPVSVPAPALPARSAPDPKRLAYVLTPAGEPNRWTYRGELVMYDTSTLVVHDRRRWSSLEGIGKPQVRGDSHVDICKAIDARLARESLTP